MSGFSRVPDKQGGTGWILPLVIGAVAGVFGSALFLGTVGSLTPNGVTFLDLAAVLLTAAAVIVTTIGVAFAIAAFWGYSNLKKSAETEAARKVEEQIENGTIRDYIREAIKSEIESPRMERRIKVRVDEVAQGNPDKDRELDYVEGDE